MRQKSIFILTAAILSLFFCAFILFYERFTLKRAQARIGTHARIIEDAMWNYNHQGVYEYLKLAAFSDRYELLTVVHQNGEVFQEIYQEPGTSLDRLLIVLRLIPKVTLEAPVSRQGETIGRVEAIWLPRTIYTHANVFIALVMVFVIIQLYLRLLRSKTRLEERVMERTAELVASNLELTKEIEERVRAEEALRTSEQKHRFLSENITDVIWALDMDLNYTYISPAAARVHGWDEAYRASMTVEKAITPASLEKGSQLLAEQLKLSERTGNYQRMAQWAKGARQREVRGTAVRLPSVSLPHHAVRQGNRPAATRNDDRSVFPTGSSKPDAFPQRLDSSARRSFLPVRSGTKSREAQVAGIHNTYGITALRCGG